MINDTTKYPFYSDKGYKYDMFTDFDPKKLSNMCMIINHYINKLDLSMLEKHCKSDKVKGGRPRFKFSRLLKIYLYSVYNHISFRKLENMFVYGSEFSYLNDGELSHPKRSTMSDFISILDEHIKEIFNQFVTLISKELSLKLEEIFCDGTVYEANNNRHKIITKDNVERSNRSQQNILNNTLSTDEQITNAKDRLIRNLKRTENLKIYSRDSYGINDSEAVIIQDKNKSYIAGYNVLLFEESEYGLIIFNYLSNLNPDSSAFIKAYEKFSEIYKITKLTADRGYLSVEIIKQFKKDGVVFVSRKKGNNFRDLHPDWKVSKDYRTITCPNNNNLELMNSKNGNYSIFRCRDSKTCVDPKCSKSMQNTHVIQVDIEKIELEDELEIVINTQENIDSYTKRANIAESPFGFTKVNTNNKKLKRIGIKRNETTIYVLSILYNLSRLISIKNYAK
ncbi:MAG: transposase [Acholeplasmatales bacterium]|jgi:transposase|nr:transposase [Acholeplasmatales bacterium]